MCMKKQAKVMCLLMTLCASLGARAFELNGSTSRFEFLVDTASVKAGDNSANAAGLALGYLYPFGRSWALHMGMGQDFALDGFSSLFVEFQVGVAYALMGSHLPVTSRVETSPGSVLETEARAPWTLSVMPFASQYLFTATTRILGVSAIGLGLHATHPLDDRWMLSGLLRVSWGTASGATLMPAQLSLGLSRELN